MRRPSANRTSRPFGCDGQDIATMYEFQRCAIGDQLGIALPPAMLARLGVKGGDEPSAIETIAGSIRSRHDFETLRQIELGKEIMRRDRDILAALAKS